MRIRGRTNSFIGLLAGGLLSLFGRAPAGTEPEDLRRADFPTSTQRMGIRFNKLIRDVFRFKWLRPARSTSASHRTQDETAGNTESD